MPFPYIIIKYIKSLFRHCVYCLCMFRAYVYPIHYVMSTFCSLSSYGSPVYFVYSYYNNIYCRYPAALLNMMCIHIERYTFTFFSI